ncbi:MAG: Wzz/FepE/Etk N-terminal domain-containing protein [Syntrophobacteraceae bacterium]|jgi:uncharacterized protein involved in exopolysaccharide biosynthesis
MNQIVPVRRANGIVPGFPAQAGRAVSAGDMGPRDILSTIFKHKLMILVSFVIITGVCCASVIFYLKFLYNPVYEAKSLILVKPGWESQDIDLTLNRRQANVNNPELLATEVRILQSRELAEKIVNSMKPEGIFPNLEQSGSEGVPVTGTALYLFQQSLSVKGSGGNIVEASFKGPNPAIAARAVNELVDYYIDKRGDTYRNPKAFLFLERKTEEYRQMLAEAESGLKAFQDQSKIISFEEQRGFLLNRQRQLVADRFDNENKMAQVQEKISELEKQLPNIQKTSIVAAENMSSLDNRLFTLELQEKELLSKYKEDNRFITNIREQIQMVKDHLKSSRGPGMKQAPVDPAYQDMQKQILQSKAEHSALKIKAKGLDEQIKDMAVTITAFEAQESKYKQLTRNVADNEEKYKTYLSKLEEARIHDELDRQKMTNVSVLEPASIPVIPNNRPLPLVVYVLISVLLGLAGSIGLAFSMEIMSPGMSTPTQAERRLELPVLAVIGCK